ncbi:MAG: mandelate racemase/muconate lactonizing enzyme family protein [Candidatus Latescibacterota bacterium]
MKITRITAHLMGIPGPGGHSPARNWTFVKVETDEGIVGVGEATTEWHEQAVVAMIEHHFAPLLIGQDPTGVTRAWQQMQRFFWWRNGVVAASAASGIEQALWDITGKAYGQPVYKLLGGAVRDRVRVYARSDLGLSNYVEEIKTAREEGITGFKFAPGKLVEPFDDEKQVDVALDLARDLRKAGGPECDLMIDCHGNFSLQAAHRLIDRIREHKMLFIEEPTNADTPGPLVALRRAFPDQRIAAGERLMTRWGFREWLETGAVDVIQADISHCGGIGELLRIASYAEIHNVRVAPHNPYGPVALAASAHACAAMPNFLILEYCRHRPWIHEVVKFGPQVAEGCVQLDDRPGLGVELDWDYVARHPYQPLDYWIYSDRDNALPCI